MNSGLPKLVTSAINILNKTMQVQAPTSMAISGYMNYILTQYVKHVKHNR